MVNPSQRMSSASSCTVPSGSMWVTTDSRCRPRRVASWPALAPLMVRCALVTLTVSLYSSGQTRMVRAFLTKPPDVKELLELLDAVAGERDSRQGVR
jgi:hypothetical protein